MRRRDIRNSIMNTSRRYTSPIFLYFLAVLLGTSCNLREMRNYGQGGSSEEEQPDKSSPRGPQDRKQKQYTDKNFNFKKKSVKNIQETSYNYSFGSTQEAHTKASKIEIVERPKPSKSFLPIEQKQAREYYEACQELRCSRERVHTLLSDDDRIGRFQKFCLEQLAGKLEAGQDPDPVKLKRILSDLKQKSTPLLCENKKCKNNNIPIFYDTVVIDYGVEPWSCFCEVCQGIDLEEKSVVRDTRLEVSLALILDYASVWEKKEIPSKNFIEYLELLEVEYANACERYAEVTIEKKHELTTKTEDFNSKSHRPHQYIPFSVFGFTSKVSQLNRLAESVDYRENRATYREYETKAKRFEDVIRYICLDEIIMLLTEEDSREYLMTMKLLSLLKQMHSTKLMEIMFLGKNDMHKVLLTLSLFAGVLPPPITNKCLEAINSYTGEYWIKNFEEVLANCAFGSGDHTARSLIARVLNFIISIDRLSPRLMSDLDPIKLSILCDFFAFKEDENAACKIISFLDGAHKFIEPSIHPSDFASVLGSYVSSSVDFGLLKTISAMHESIRFEHLIEIFKCRYPRIISHLVHRKVFDLSPEELSRFYHNLELQNRFLDAYSKYYPESKSEVEHICSAIEAAISCLDKVSEYKVLENSGNRIFEDARYRESCEGDLRKIGSIRRQGGSIISDKKESASKRSSVRRTERGKNPVSKSELFPPKEGDEEEGEYISSKLSRESQQ